MTNYEPPAIPQKSSDPWAEYEVAAALRELTDVANEHRQQTGHRVLTLINGPLSVNIRCTTCHPLGLRTYDRPPGNVYRVDDPDLQGPGERPTILVDAPIDERLGQMPSGDMTNG